MYDGFAIVGLRAPGGEREVRAYGQSKGSCHQAGLPAPIPGADHDGDRKDYQAALHHVGEHEGWNECENNTEDSDAVPEDGGPSRCHKSSAEKGELRSHTKSKGSTGAETPRVTGVPCGFC